MSSCKLEIAKHNIEYKVFPLTAEFIQITKELELFDHFVNQNDINQKIKSVLLDTVKNVNKSDNNQGLLAIISLQMMINKPDFPKILESLSPQIKLDFDYNDLQYTNRKINTIIDQQKLDLLEEIGNDFSKTIENISINDIKNTFKDVFIDRIEMHIFPIDNLHTEKPANYTLTPNINIPCLIHQSAAFQKYIFGITTGQINNILSQHGLTLYKAYPDFYQKYKKQLKDLTNRFALCCYFFL